MFRPEVIVGQLRVAILQLRFSRGRRRQDDRAEGVCHASTSPFSDVDSSAFPLKYSSFLKDPLPL